MTAQNEEQIRARAHAIWEQEGKPDGRSEEHWSQACEEVSFEFSTLENAAGARDSVAAKPAMVEKSAPPAARRRTAAGLKKQPGEASSDAAAPSPKAKAAPRARKATASRPTPRATH
jgi:hypothetical protein